MELCIARRRAAWELSAKMLLEQPWQRTVSLTRLSFSESLPKLESVHFLCLAMWRLPPPQMWQSISLGSEVCGEAPSRRDLLSEEEARAWESDAGRGPRTLASHELPLSPKVTQSGARTRSRLGSVSNSPYVTVKHSLPAVEKQHGNVSRPLLEPQRTSSPCLHPEG